MLIIRRLRDEPRMRLRVRREPCTLLARQLCRNVTLERVHAGPLGGVPVTIEDPACVRKTYPEYFTALARILS